ncbi:MAG: efflux RND transporter permease subunit [Myxococcaceae bacterium]|nr:efflux RND transporter permease subunit [Myxococcaceae bacterium]
MISSLISGALKLRVAVACLSVVLMVWGLDVVSRTPLDVFPEFAPPLVEIQTEAPGLSTSEVEALISVPLESALNGTPWMKVLRSKSVLGLSSVVLIFEEGTDLLKARQLVSERLSIAASSLPAVSRPPVMMSPLSSTSRAMKIGVSSKTLSQVEMTTLVRWTMRPRLMAVPGVANVAVWGQRDRQLQVLVSPEQLAAGRVTLDQVAKAAGDATRPQPGGFIDSPNQRLPVTHVSAVRGAGDLAQVPVASRRGASVLLGDVATVTEGHQPPIGDAIINDGPGLLLIVEKQPWGNTLELTRNVEAAVEQMRPGLTGLDIDTTIFRPATYIERSLDNLNHALLIGCLLVVLILAVFLWEWRTAVISLAAIPLSLITAGLVLHFRGGTLNTMVLAGLVIALGEVVDDAIIDVENIVRRLELNAKLAEPKSAFEVVLQGSLEVRSAVVYATMIVALVFLPVFMLDGLAGSFFRPLALSYLLAVTASLGVALVVTPALSLLLLPGAKRGAHRDSPVMPPLRRAYRRLLEGVMKRPKLAPAALVGLALATAAAVPFLGEDFLPHFKELDFLMHWVEKPGSSLEAMNRITLAASKELRAVPGVRNFGSHIGRAEVADEVVGPNFTELWISLDPDAEYDATVAKIQSIVDGYPGLYRDLLTYLRERVKEVLTGGGGSVVVRLYGPSLDTLREQAQLVGAKLAKVDGVSDLKVEPQVLVPQVEISLKPQAASAFGLTAGDVRRTVATMVKGLKVGEIYEEQKSFDVVVWGGLDNRHDVAALRELLIDLPLPGSGQVPLREVAEVRITPTPNVIVRESASRRIDVSCNVKGRDLGSVARDVEAAVKAMPFPAGHHPEVLGEYAARQQSQRRLGLFALLAFIGIFLVLYSDFGTARLALLVFISLPFALVGGVAATLLGSGVLSLGALVGFVTVIGIAARNGIMLISHYRHLETEEGVPFGLALVLRGAEERLRPILMTALATGLALVPIVMGGVRPGHEIEHPLAVVIVGGLVSSTALNLFLMPALYLRWGRPKGQ